MPTSVAVQGDGTEARRRVAIATRRESAGIFPFCFPGNCLEVAIGDAPLQKRGRMHRQLRARWLEPPGDVPAYRLPICKNSKGRQHCVTHASWGRLRQRVLSLKVKDH